MKDVEIIAGANIGNRIFLSRINLKTKGTDLPFILNRLQFSVKLASCMSINKSQGPFKKSHLLKSELICHNQFFRMVSENRGLS